MKPNNLVSALVVLAVVLAVRCAVATEWAVRVNVPDAQIPDYDRFTSAELDAIKSNGGRYRYYPRISEKFETAMIEAHAARLLFDEKGKAPDNPRFVDYFDNQYNRFYYDGAPFNLLKSAIVKRRQYAKLTASGKKLTAAQRRDFDNWNKIYTGCRRPVDVDITAATVKPYDDGTPRPGSQFYWDIDNR